MLANLDELLGKGVEQLEQVARRLEGAGANARRAEESVDLLLRGAERARAAVTRARRR